METHEHIPGQNGGALFFGKRLQLQYNHFFVVTNTSLAEQYREYRKTESELVGNLFLRDEEEEGMITTKRTPVRSASWATTKKIWPGIPLEHTSQSKLDAGILSERNVYGNGLEVGQNLRDPTWSYGGTVKLSPALCVGGSSFQAGT